MHSSWILDGAFAKLGVNIPDGYQVRERCWSVLQHVHGAAVVPTRRRHLPPKNKGMEAGYDSVATRRFSLLTFMQAAFAPLRALYRLVGARRMEFVQAYIIDAVVDWTPSCLPGYMISSATFLAVVFARSKRV